MARMVDLQAVVKHIVNGSFEDNLCRLCLLPLGECYEDVFTKVCKEGKEYCIADILNEVCQVQITHSGKYHVCSNCFFEASSAYKFYLLSKRTEEILAHYVNELNEHIGSIIVPEECSSDSMCIKMPIFTPSTEIFNYDLSGLCLELCDKQFQDLHSDVIASNRLNKKVSAIQENIEAGNMNIEEYLDIDKAEKEKEGEIKANADFLIILSENNEQSYFTINGDDSLVPVGKEDVKLSTVQELQADLDQASRSDSLFKEVIVKRRRKRAPMNYKKCSQCPIKYRFVAKLKEHMKIDHNIDIFVCSVCKAIIENENEFNNHLKTHTNIHRCSICNAVFKKLETIITHIKSHEATKELSKAQSAHICEICGWILKDEASLKEHHQDKHIKKYTCYYCGRMYKGEISFDVHIKKHEAHLNVKHKRSLVVKKEPSNEKVERRRYECKTCPKSFVDERSLMWHERLHADERPYVCKVCGRGFVSVNRRNQHALCAHTAPARRCPLCPALFHLRSMVNSHIKKVHLQTSKRRNRTSKHQNVFWRTEPVPFQELSVAVQNDILELKTNQLRCGTDTETRLSQQEDFLDAYCTVKVPISDKATNKSSLIDGY